MIYRPHRTAPAIPDDPATTRTLVPAAAPPLCGRQPRIAVVGASLTGPVLALLLVQAGFDQVAVYEASPDLSTATGGILSLEHPALDVLDRLGIPQHEYVKFDFETITQFRGYGPAEDRLVRRRYPGRFTTWTLLHQALASRLPAGLVHHGRRVTGIDVANRGPLLAFADGRRESADLIAFCDGRTSIGRRLLDPDRRLHYAGYVAHRGTTITRPGDLADFQRWEPCPGLQFNIAPVPAGSDWIFALNATPEQYTAWFGAPPRQRTFVLPQHVSPAARAHVDAHATAHLPAHLADLVHTTATRMAVPVMDIDPPTRMAWPVGDGHAVLLGDALAPVRAHTARGFNNGIEQADGLVSALRQHTRHGADLTGALLGWRRRHLITALAAVRQGPIIGARLGLGTTSALDTSSAPGTARGLATTPAG
ncbi:FAD-dependent monooxygenase [Virgisporangium aurantiacum]|uniref:2-polyprenyl-6-methoxyphenol hydroxylase n=1 Tax=Virgisporangium aurantiacum TaxID=175570 RepID=A0A8J3ZJH0_9ACTN|nr:FAD-dependent monooxygenase [Virgisporangium aurantiacum]GIJ64906.1 2-polyprenyl-6-methoxyphenol hydroxylase [Virgisporangium aurantiacum]